MRDYTLVLLDGSECKVAQAPTELICDFIANGFDVFPNATFDKDAGLERLKLELEIRAMGLGEVE